MQRKNKTNNDGTNKSVNTKMLILIIIRRLLITERTIMRTAEVVIKIIIIKMT